MMMGVRDGEHSAVFVTYLVNCHLGESFTFCG